MSKKELPRGVPEEQTPIPGGSDKGPPPKFGTQRPADAGGEIPRVVDPLDRSPNKDKYMRVKIRCNNYTPQKIRYILTTKDEAGEAAARDLYLKVNGIADTVKRLEKNEVKDIAKPDLVVTVLED